MGPVTIYPLTRSDISFQTRHQGLITDRHVGPCLLVFPVCPLLLKFIPDHDASAIAHAAMHARTLSRGALGRPPPCVHVPAGDTRARTLLSTAIIASVMSDTGNTDTVSEQPSWDFSQL
eukprot:5937755-Pleurochrysis_carterae.AAC.2